MKILFLFLSTYYLLYSQDNLDTRVLELETQMQTLKNKMTLHQDELDERMPIIEMIEKKSILDKLNLSPEIELRVDKFNYKLGKITGENTIIQTGEYAGEQRRDEYTKNFDPSGYIHFRLNMNAQLDGKTSFHGRLIFANSTQANQRVCILSRDIKSHTSTSAFDLDRAYIDFTPNKNSDYAFTFSFGLLPTSGGTPMQFAQNTQRKSMFPALVFDMNSYGIILTQKFANESFARIILAKAYTLRDTFYPYQCNRENIDNATIIGAYSDTQFDILGGDTLLSFGVNMLQNLKAHPYLGPDVTASNTNVLGNMVTLGLGIDLKNIQQSGLTVFAHTALSNPHANGQIDDYQITTTNGVQNNPSDIGFSTAEYAKGEMLGSNGTSFYIGAKYDISQTLAFGTEYNYGSKYWFSATQGAEDMYNKLATRGDATEIYGMWKFHANLYAKLGFLQINEDYTGSGWHFGEPASKEGVQNISYLSLSAKF